MEHLAALRDLAEQRGLKPLHETLRQRYPHDASWRDDRRSLKGDTSYAQVLNISVVR